MALSIRNSKAEKPAREVAAESRENLTQAIIHALEERLERLRGRRTAIDLPYEIMRIAHRCNALPDLDPRTPEKILGYNNFGPP